MDDYGWDFSNEQDWWTPTSDPQVISVQAGDMGDYTNYATDVNYGLDGYQYLSPQSNYTYDLSGMDYANNTPYAQSLVASNIPQITGNIQTTQNTNVAPTNAPSGVFGELGQAYDKFKEKPLSSTIDALGSKTGLALLGMGANLYGNVLNQKATQQGQQNYLKAVQWTPERTENYMNALRNNVASLYGGAAQGQNKAMAASNAARGRGGGTYGNQTQAVSREMRENMAKALNSGALTTNTPVNAGMAAYTQTSPVGQTLTGIGGDLASINNSSMQMDYLRKLGIIK
jgi:hypothetical protein